MGMEEMKMNNTGIGGDGEMEMLMIKMKENE